MRDNLLLYHTITAQKRQWLPGERITRVRNLALFLTGLYLSRKVHLSLIAEEWHLPGKTPSLVNRLRRFLDNPRVSVRDYYRPVAESMVSAFRGVPIRLIIDTTKIGFDARLLVDGTFRAVTAHSRTPQDSRCGVPSPPSDRFTLARGKSRDIVNALRSQPACSNAGL